MNENEKKTNQQLINLPELKIVLGKALDDATTLGEIRGTLIVNFGKDGRALKYIGEPVDDQGMSTMTLLLEVLERLTVKKQAGI